MLLIVGLGNIGKDYETTRHNLGFLFVDYLYGQLKHSSDYRVSDWKEDKIFDSQISYVTDEGTNEKVVCLMKPTTLMNNSGMAVGKFAKKNGIANDEIVVAFDDLDLEFSTVKLSLNRFPKAHNGISSVQKHLGGTDVWYLRIGSESRDTVTRSRITGEDFVLMKLSKDELSEVNQVFEQAIKLLRENVWK